MVGPAATDLEACQALEAGDVVGVDLKRGAVGREGLVGAAGALEGEGEVEAGVGVSGHVFLCERKLPGGLIKLALAQEEDAQVVIDPLQTQDDALLSSNPEVAAAAAEAQAGSEQPLDGSSAPVGVEQAQATSPSPQVVTYLDREYIWGPGDRGVDELLVQYDRNRNPWWVLQDDGGDIVALCDRGSSGTGNGRVVAQYTYDAYGAVLTATHLYAHAHLRCGHKGLFVDRLDVGVTGMYGAESPRLVPFAHTLCQNRNRVYCPQLGRFLQPDPNSTGQLLLAASSGSGRGAAAVSVAFDLEDHHGDGLNVYEYLGSNPWNRSDSLGLSWDPFDMADEFLADSAGERAALLSQLGQAAKATAILAATIASYMPFPMAGVVGDMALAALGEQSEGAAAVGIALGLIPGGKLAGKFAGFIGRIGSSAWGAAKHYAGRFTGALANKARGLFARAKSWLRRKPGAARGCFAAGTLVWTTRGMIPIEQVRVGDTVLARDETSGVLMLRSVEAEIVKRDTALLELMIEDQHGCKETILTTDEHPFWLKGRGWVRADALRPGQAVEGLEGDSVVLTVSFTGNRTTVYNLSIEGSPNYFVGTDGVWVHNSGKDPICFATIVKPKGGFPHVQRGTAVMVNVKTGQVRFGGHGQTMHDQVVLDIPQNQRGPDWVGGIVDFQAGKPVNPAMISGGYQATGEALDIATELLNDAIRKFK